MSNISINVFDELVLIMKPFREKNAMGQVIETWADFRKTLGKVEEAQVGEKQEASKITLARTIVVSTHYDREIDTTFRLKWNEEVYNILSIVPVQGRYFMRVTAEKATL